MIRRPNRLKKYRPSKRKAKTLYDLLLTGEVQQLNPKQCKGVLNLFERCSKYTVYRDALFGCLFANGLNVKIDDSLRDLIEKNDKTDEETYKELERFSEGALDYLLLYGIVPMYVDGNGNANVPPLDSGLMYWRWDAKKKLSEYFWVWKQKGLNQAQMMELKIDKTIVFYEGNRPTWDASITSAIRKILDDFEDLEYYKQLDKEAEKSRTKGQHYYQEKFPPLGADQFNNFAMYNQHRELEDLQARTQMEKGPEYRSKYQQQISSLYGQNPVMSESGGIGAAFSGSDAFNVIDTPILDNINRRFGAADEERVGPLLDLVQINRPPTNTRLMDLKRDFDSRLSEAIAFASNSGGREGSSNAMLKESVSLQKTIANNKIKKIQQHMEVVLTMAHDLLYGDRFSAAYELLKDPSGGKADIETRVSIHIVPIAVLPENMITEIISAIKETTGDVVNDKKMQSLFTLLKVMTGIDLEDIQIQLDQKRTLKKDVKGNQKARKTVKKIVDGKHNDPGLVDLKGDKGDKKKKDEPADDDDRDDESGDKSSDKKDSNKTRSDNSDKSEKDSDESAKKSTSDKGKDKPTKDKKEPKDTQKETDGAKKGKKGKKSKKVEKSDGSEKKRNEPDDDKKNKKSDSNSSDGKSDKKRKREDEPDEDDKKSKKKQKSDNK
jgi:hypothetical protein